MIAVIAALPNVDMKGGRRCTPPASLLYFICNCLLVVFGRGKGSKKRQSASEDFCNRSSVSSFRLQSSVSSYSYHHRHQHHSSFISTSVEGSTRSQHSDYLQSYDLTSADGPNRSGYSSVPSSGHVVQPVPHYLPINLKAFSQRMLYGYPMLNKPQYPLTIPSRSSH
ncbi:uncharacterized protein TNCV_985141 [Trichonephila clavipes]|nr:uncharacterized protein TNCV_985141 [Trichonephila clavipes]